ncbi:conserved hypothetical protein [Pyrenophora tritici-repentis Pt-1C-BFP]|uniref:Uncharacterized protein n=1 Tax=Pyrenophora tritici-repentis (strain Pt-1C-BFP) TaxID=426418 RepID=B2VQZ3_PYRTR|nr:uncharacterized protein PTRG_00590 [Pyrenophora tritici-repentis Pt-1C-BFP]EDU40028.1 conserved hypothetical protein [Pyrenophora tritici-repentis Pt-1C-BFP]
MVLHVEHTDLGLDQLLIKLHRNEEVSPSLVKSIAAHASTLAENICTNYTTLHTILTCHESTIRRRWSKKSILLTAWPNVPEFHRPDYRAFASTFATSDNADELEDTPVAERILPPDENTWPFINLEDLSKPKCLLTFLNSRDRNPPYLFALTEEYFSPLATLPPCGPKPELKKHLNAAIRVIEEYSVTEDGFLVACSQHILHGMSEEVLLCGHVQEQPPASDLEMHRDFGQTDFSDLLMAAPYRNRRSLDFSRLRDYFSALYTSAKDHILALREDPSYFAEVFEELAYHSPKEIVIEAYTMFAAWKELYEILDRLVEAFQGNSHDRFSCLMGEFDCRTRNVSVLLSKMIHGYHATAPNIRKFYVREDDSTASPKLKFMRGSIGTSEEIQLIVAFQQLYHTLENPLPDQVLHHILDNMATILRNSKPARDLMSPRVSELFTQLTIVGECLMHCSLWRETPKGYAVDHDMPHSHDEKFLKWLYHPDCCQLPVQSINPFRGKLAYPVHKVRNSHNVKTMRTVEANLDKFWECVTGTFNKLAIQEKVKNKTKGNAAAPKVVEPAADSNAPAHETSAPPQTFKLDRRTYKTMRALFHVSCSDTEDFPKAIKWDEFKRAMVRLGFATEKLQGSA